MEYRKDIQGLRAIAVLFVLIFHLNSNWLPGGFVGVDMFFVISGFLISSIILSQSDKGEFSFLGFYKSRIKRIVPAYYFLLVVIAVAGIFIFVSSDIRAFRKSFFWSILFNSNYYFSTLDTYFGVGNSENPFLHTWTLAIEMQFYLFLPLFLVFIKRKWLTAFVSILTVVLFIYGSFNIFNGNKNLMYFSLLARIPEFLIGVLCSLIFHKLKLSKHTAFSLSIAGLILLFVSAIFINENSNFPGILALIPCLGVAFLISVPENPIKAFLSNKVLSFIGDLSYSLYLWHWPIMAFFRYYYNTYEFTFIQYIIVILIAFSLSLFSYYCIETYLRKKGSIRFWGCLILLGSLNMAAMFFFIPMNKKVSDIPFVYTSPTFGINSHGCTFMHVETFGDTLYAKNKILLLGDSHALCMKSYFDYIGKAKKFSFKTVTNDIYPTIPNLLKEDFDTDKNYRQYLNLMQHANKEIDESDIIILEYHFDGDKWILPISELIKNLNPNQHFILISDFPTIDKNPIRVNRGIVRNLSCDNVYKEKYLKQPTKIINLVKSTPNCHYLDLSKSKIFDEIPFYKDTVMYYDSGHLNIYGAKIYAQDTETDFMNLLNSVFSQ